MSLLIVKRQPVTFAAEAYSNKKKKEHINFILKYFFSRFTLSKCVDDFFIIYRF